MTPTREQCIEWAREAGDDIEHTLPSDIDFLVRFATLAYAAGAAEEPEILGYALFREGKQQGIERSLSQASRWVDAEIVPLVRLPSQQPLPEGMVMHRENFRCDYRAMAAAAKDGAGS